MITRSIECSENPTYIYLTINVFKKQVFVKIIQDHELEPLEIFMTYNLYQISKKHAIIAKLHNYQLFFNKKSKSIKHVYRN